MNEAYMNFDEQNFDALIVGFREETLREKFSRENFSKSLTICQIHQTFHHQTLWMCVHIYIHSQALTRTHARVHVRTHTHTHTRACAMHTNVYIFVMSRPIT